MTRLPSMSMTSTPSPAEMMVGGFARISFGWAIGCQTDCAFSAWKKSVSRMADLRVRSLLKHEKRQRLGEAARRLAHVEGDGTHPAATSTGHVARLIVDEDACRRGHAEGGRD